MTVDTTELRTRARLIEPGFPGTAAAVAAAADEIDALRNVTPEVAVTGTATTDYPDVTRLTVAGPHGRVVGLPQIAGVLVDVDGPHLTVSYTNPERNT